MNKTRIEWANYTWNPVKGLCPVGCWYCYARRMYQRFGWPSEISLDTDPIERYGRISEGSRIFVCSTMEIFHPEVRPSYRDFIFKNIKDYSKLTFIVLTKMPENIDRPMPENAWLGVSVSRREDQWRIDRLHEASAWTRFVSFEPLFDEDAAIPNGLLSGLDWVIVGRLTGHGHKLDPKREAIESIVKAAHLWNIPVFLKNNLSEIWGKSLIQEYPKSGKAGEEKR